MDKRLTNILMLFSVGLLIFHFLRFSWQTLAVMMVYIYILTAFLPVCRKCESTWLFLFAIPVLTPLNYRIAEAYFEGTAQGSWLNIGIAFLHALIVFFVALSIEEILIGILGRIIWPRQYRILSKEQGEVVYLEKCMDIFESDDGDDEF